MLVARIDLMIGEIHHILKMECELLKITDPTEIEAMEEDINDKQWAFQKKWKYEHPDDRNPILDILVPCYWNKKTGKFVEFDENSMEVLNKLSPSEGYFRDDDEHGGLNKILYEIGSNLCFRFHAGRAVYFVR